MIPKPTSIMVFDTADDRDATLINPNVGQGAYVVDVGLLYLYDLALGGWFVIAGGIGGGRFWAYDGSTLSPDPATTTPLDLFNVNATDGSVFGQVAAFVTGGLPGAQITSTGTGLNTSVQVGDAVNGVLAAADDGTGDISLALNGDGSFSLTADDGTNTDTISSVSGNITIQATDGSNAGTVAVQPSGVVITGDGSGAGQVVVSGEGSLMFSALVDATALVANLFTLWLDPTPGATKLMIRAKDSGGTVRTAAIALT